jgi:ankyrin repeat protein
MFIRAILPLIASGLLLATPPPKVSKVPPEGATKLLVSSIDSKDIAGVRIAFEQGADPNVGDQKTPMAHGLNALWFAAYVDAPDPATKELKKVEEQKKAMEILKFLFNKGAKLKNDPDELFTAVVCNNKAAFEYLLSKGLNPHGSYKGYDLVQLSFVYHADLNIPLLEKRGAPKIDPHILPVLKMIRAVRAFDDKELSRLIKEEKTDVNQYDPTGRTVLMEILSDPFWLHDAKMLFPILDAHPDWNLPSKADDDFGQYPLHFVTFASKYSHQPEQLSSISTLVALAIRTMGANPYVINTLRETPLHNAAAGGAVATIITLLQYGADPLAVDSRFRRPSQVATAPDVVRLLAEAETAARKPN